MKLVSLLLFTALAALCLGQGATSGKFGTKVEPRSEKPVEQSSSAQNMLVLPIVAIALCWGCVTIYTKFKKGASTIVQNHDGLHIVAKGSLGSCNVAIIRHGGNRWLMATNGVSQPTVLEIPEWVEPVSRNEVGDAALVHEETGDEVIESADFGDRLKVLLEG
ncbi:MAG: hypothetical protein KIT11_03035 [Fimbriimonadaceae bacterium]|nr:hypothetical protein [Fimbriimonadaceae bacterium]QYK57128.1 MAG: hypothetical protein KF733_06490 [Fimbriimonadaceae bacterium]